MASQRSTRWEHLLLPDDAPVDTACHAPFSTLFFDTVGQVRSCCRNTTHLLGHVGSHTIREIWDGDVTAVLRDAVIRGDFSLGCQWCSVHEEQGDAEHVYLRLFDQYAPSVARPAWPTRMEFSLSSVCNLECVMCHGDLSSTIRRKRDLLPPLPDPYTDAFFAELAEFVPHLTHAGFAGGEPFLARPALRVFDLLIDRAPHVRCNVATNGTQWNARVERVLDALAVDVAVSIDGGSAAVFEAIRTGARFDQVVANLDRFITASARHGTVVEIDHCLMPQNVDHFAELLLFAEDRGRRVAVNAVREPKAFSLDHLDEAPMREAAASLDRQAEAWAHRLPINGAVLLAEADRLRRRLAVVESGGSFPDLPVLAAVPEVPTIAPNSPHTPELLGLPRQGAGPVASDAAGARVRAHTGADPYRVVVDECELLADLDAATAGYLGVDPAHWVGRPLSELMPVVLARFGAPVGEERIHADPDLVELDVLLADRRVRVVEAVDRDDDGRAIGGAVWFSG